MITFDDRSQKQLVEAGHTACGVFKTVLGRILVDLEHERLTYVRCGQKESGTAYTTRRSQYDGAILVLKDIVTELGDAEDECIQQLHLFYENQQAQAK